MSTPFVALEPGVHPFDFWKWHGHMSPTSSFIGEMPAGCNSHSMTHYYDGVYGFSNPYSANMFSYLRRIYGPSVAIPAVILFEKKLTQSTGAKFKEFIGLDWGSFIFNGGKVFLQKSASAGIKAALDPKSIIESMVVQAGGKIFMAAMLNNANPELNPYPAESSQDEYVQYAIAYWAKFPGNGPAYRIRRDNLKSH